jgi:imidazolonepropionase-like amidohydrolase
MKKILPILFFWYFSSMAVFGQATFHPNGVADQRSEYILIKNATLHVDATTIITNGWMLLKNDKIEKVGKDFSYPKSAFVVDLSGKHVFPSFVDAYSDYGMPEIKRAGRRSYYDMVFESEKKGAYAWNQALKPEVKAAEIFVGDAKKAGELRKLGFGAVVSHAQDGIVRGTSALLSLQDTQDQLSLLKSDVSSHYSFSKGSSTQSYPVSLMGSVALLRQTYYDADWYTKGGSSKERNLSLESFAKNLALPSIFDGNSFADLLRADKIGSEFSTKYILKTGGDEYQRISEVKALGAHLIVPVNFPKTPDLDDPMDAEEVTLETLKHWEMAPTNLGALASNGVSFSITTADLVDKTTFLTNIKKAIKLGLTKEAALAALTSNPAKALKIDNQVGSLKTGLYANFLVTSDDVFAEKSKILENWVQGQKYVITDESLSEINGTYSLTLGTESLKMEITGENDKPNIEIIESDSIKIKVTAKRDRDFLNLTFKRNPKDEGIFRLTGYSTDGKISGEGKTDKGADLVWTAVKTKGADAAKADSAKTEKPEKIGNVIYPFVAFGNESLPKSKDMLIKNATIWTNDKDGRIVGDVLIKNGKIDAVGKNLSAAAGVEVIDGTNKHLTNGIIDEHSHIALFSINEVESVSSEVRQEDVIDSEDTDIYRQLAGGVTTSQLLHGSADCIGGQSAIIKLKWGENANKLIIPNSPKFIKFALGENVKRGNSPQAPNRYPSTRMGVEQVIQDAFVRTINYKKTWTDYNSKKVKTGLEVPRKDLELETLVEILDGNRNITCHSYVQSEINMLLKLADSLGFKVNTLTHILEGYKVADKMKERGVNASTFSDWWAYKMEVKEAIPYNAAIMSKVGVNVAINSDDAEMARRLNQEAAKTILYGGLSEEEAWKTVTLNPAKMLHLDDRLGTIKKGMDADLVLWTDNPLSIYAKPEKTIIDGAVYFDMAKEDKKMEELNAEKNRLTQKALASKTSGAPTAKPNTRKKPAHVHCDSMLEFGGMSVELYESMDFSNYNSEGK